MNPYYNNYQPMYPSPYQDRLAQLQAQYQQAIPPQQMQQPAAQPQTSQGLLWVQGEAGAKAYLVAPGTTVLLMDSEGSRFYLKSSDGAGMPNLRTFEFREITQTAQNAPQATQTSGTNLDDKYVTRKEYESLMAQYGEIVRKIDGLSAPAEKPVKASTTKTKGGNADEQ